MGRAQTGIRQDKQGFWCVDRIYKGSRLRNRFESFEEAQGWLIFQLEQLRQIHLYGIRAYSTETGRSVHGKLDSRSVATRGLFFTPDLWV